MLGHNLFVPSQRLRRRAIHDLPLADHMHKVSKSKGQWDVLLHQQDRKTSRFELAYDVTDFPFTMSVWTTSTTAGDETIFSPFCKL